MKNLRININDLLYKLLLLFPITTLLQSFISIINVLLFALVTVCLIYLLLKKPIKKAMFILIVLVIINHLFALSYTVFPKINNMNTLYYYMFWILFCVYVCVDYDHFVNFFEKSKAYVCKILTLLVCIMGISIFVPSSYASGYFKSFSGSSARVCSVAIFMMTLILLAVKFYNEKQYAKYIVVPIYCIVMGDSRTYLVVGIILLFILLWNYFDKKKYFYYSLIPIAILGAVVIISTNIMDKMLVSLDYQDNAYYNAIEVFTSGRSTFWVDMLKAYWNSGNIHRLLGDGFHFVYTIRTFWAHNDFVQLLLTFGLLGLFTYLWSIRVMVRTFTRGGEAPWFIVLAAYILWFFNAFFNMFYVYMCASISFPILLMTIGQKNKNKVFEDAKW